MASLRAVAQTVLEEARDGIAWIALYRVGRGWKAACFWPDRGRDGTFTFDGDDAAELRDILATDPNAIFVNGYDTNLGPIEGMTRETLTHALRWQYDGQYCRLADDVSDIIQRGRPAVKYQTCAHFHIRTPSDEGTGYNPFPSCYLPEDTDRRPDVLTQACFELREGPRRRVRQPPGTRAPPPLPAVNMVVRSPVWASYLPVSPWPPRRMRADDMPAESIDCKKGFIFKT